jgi:hypothetical protein
MILVATASHTHYASQRGFESTEPPAGFGSAVEGVLKPRLRHSVGKLRA